MTGLAHALLHMPVPKNKYATAGPIKIPTYIVCKFRLYIVKNVEKTTLNVRCMHQKKTLIVVP